jgi:hypothetical protein
MSWHQPYGSRKGQNGELRNARGHEIDAYGTDLEKARIQAADRKRWSNDDDDEEEEDDDDGYGGGSRRRPSRKSKKSVKSSRKYKKSAKRVFRKKSRSTRRR